MSVGNNPHQHDEHTPLLGQTLGHRQPPTICKVNVWKEAGEMIPLAWPVSVGYLLQMSLNMAAVMALGRLGTNALASMALATLYANVTGYSLVVGMGAAIDTLCSQAYGEYLAGVGDKKELGRHLTRTIFAMYVTCVPVAILWWFTEPLLLLAGQDPAVARLSGHYTLLLAPSLIPFVISECVKRFLMAQGIMHAQMIVIAIVTPINCLLQYIFVFTDLRIGSEGAGAPFALTISHCLIAISLVLYAFYVEGGDAYCGWEWDQVLNTKKLKMVVSLGTSGVLMTCTEWWAWDIIALAAGHLGPEYLAAQTIVLSATSWAYTMPLGVAIACTTRIGNALGAGKPEKAKLASFVVLVIGLFLATINSTCLMLGRSYLGHIFTDETAVVVIVDQIVPLAAVFQLADVLGCICGGILRGAGRPEIGAYLNLIGYYVVGIPFGILLCFQMGWGMFGLWTGLTAALFIVSLIEIYMIYRLDWDQEAENAHLRSLEGLDQCDEAEQ
ncbi:mate-domain-containing protein [Obelidium mucronatum]|nr:mate-domain-containing protein [Obelidium mucronatum]